MKTQLKKAKHLWTVIAQGSVTDSLTNNLSINNVLEQIQIGKHDASGKTIIPTKGEAIPINFQIISLWKKLTDQKDEFSIDGKLEVLDPSGKVLVSQLYSIAMMKDKERMRSIINFQGFKITLPGEYTFKLYARDNSRDNFVEVAEDYLTIQFSIAG